MSSNVKAEKDFDTVRVFRIIKDKISQDIQGMTFEELEAYLNSSSSTPNSFDYMRPLSAEDSVERTE